MRYSSMKDKKTISNRKECLISVGSIKMDRYPMNPSTIRLIDYMREGGIVPAIKVAKLQSGGFIIRDGRHRVLAHKMLGRTEILARFSGKPMINR